MEQLYSIMREFLEVEYHQESLVRILNAIETAYGEDEQGEVKWIVNGIKFYLKDMQTEFRTTVNRLDTYIAERVKKQ